MSDGNPYIIINRQKRKKHLSKSENIQAFEKAMNENTELREKFEAA